MEDKQVVIINQVPKRQSTPLSSSIQISVEDPQINSKDAISHFTYQIVGSDLNGSFDVRRRYSDFDLLRKRMAHRWLGIYLPPISGKRAQNNPLYLLKFLQKDTNEARYADTRKRFLRYFCQGIAIRPFLFYCDIFQLFLRGGSNFQQAINSTGLKKEYIFILNAYEQSFLTLVTNNKLETQELVISNDKHYNSLKQSESILQAIFQKILKATQCRSNFNKQFNNVMSKTLPQYEQKSLLNHFGKDREKLLLTKNNNFELEMEKFKEINSINPLQNFLEMIMYEIREVKAFMEAIQGRRQAQKRIVQLKQKVKEKQIERTKLQQGKVSFKSIFKPGSKDLHINQLTMKLQIMRNELNCLQKMMVMMLVNTNYELEQYRVRRGKEYAQVFKKVAQEQLTQLVAYEQLLQIPLLTLS